MRPGPMDFATGDLFTTPPSVGDETKLEPTAALKLQGFHGNDQVGPEFVNWMLNRLGLLHQFAAKVMAGNWTKENSNTVVFGGAGFQMLASCGGIATTDSQVTYFFADVTGAAMAVEVSGAGGRIFPENPAGATNVINPGNLTTRMDADQDDADIRVCCFDGGATDQVAASTAGGAWALCTLPVGPAPALNFRAVGTDRNTAGGAQALWAIGDDGAGGFAELYTATAPAGAGFSQNANFNGLNIAESVRGIHHSCHPADALGPDDAGNPVWMVLTATRVVTSPDGATWTNVAAHGLGSPSKKQVAYSRTSGRWLGVTNGGAGATRYSDDNGATWAAGPTLPYAAALGSSTFQIKCDGYGTFVVIDDAANVWISTDEGVSFTGVRMHLDDATGWSEQELEVLFDAANNWNTAGDSATAFSIATFDENAGATQFEAFRSLGY